MSRVLILLGPPGAGKGTQAARLATELGLPHVSTGDLFRENKERGTELGRRAQQYMDKGDLVPDDIVLEMLFDRVARKDCARGYILDGFPRTLAQAQAWEKRAAQGTQVQVVNLVVPDAVLVKRSAGRGRTDDDPQVFARRLAVYRKLTLPLEAHFRERGLLNDVDGDKTPDEVFEKLKSAAATGVRA